MSKTVTKDVLMEVRGPFKDFDDAWLGLIHQTKSVEAGIRMALDLSFGEVWHEPIKTEDIKIEPVLTYDSEIAFEVSTCWIRITWKTE